MEESQRSWDWRKCSGATLLCEAFAVSLGAGSGGVSWELHFYPFPRPRKIRPSRPNVRPGFDSRIIISATIKVCCCASDAPPRAMPGTEIVIDQHEQTDAGAEPREQAEQQAGADQDLSGHDQIAEQLAVRHDVGLVETFCTKDRDPAPRCHRFAGRSSHPWKNRAGIF